MGLLCDTGVVPSADICHGIRLFNSADFFEAHEVLEDVWRAAPEPERKFLQGLIQVAVALHHHSRGNQVGCRSLLERARRNLAPYPEQHRGVDLAALLHSVDQWRTALDQGQAVPALPVLHLRE
ncbi:MAG: DUF309 domain-containing protein [Terriglobales bacterium]